MGTLYQTQSYVEASKQLDKVCDWLETLGVNYSPTRVGKYKEIFSRLAAYQAENNFDGFFECVPFEEFVNAAYEVAELVRMYEGLNGHNDPDLVARLREALKGHELYLLDNQGRSGRDFSFELAIASKFARCGFAIDFGHQADLKAQINGHPLYVECKRIRSLRKVKRRIKDGLGQLHRRYVKSESPEKARGLLVLSIGKAINSDFGLLEANSLEHLKESAFRHNERFINQNKQYWHTAVDQRTVGVVVILDAPCVIKDGYKFTTCHEVTINNCVPPSTEGYAHLVQIAYHVFGHQI